MNPLQHGVVLRLSIPFSAFYPVNGGINKYLQLDVGLSNLMWMSGKLPDSLYDACVKTTAQMLRRASKSASAPPRGEAWKSIFDGAKSETQWQYADGGTAKRTA
jgi:hypothetical protein